jgi:membrane fusion protein, type I secretion system
LKNALRTGVVERLTTGEGRGVIETNRLADIQDILIQVETSLGEVISELSRVRGASGEARLSLLKLEQQYRERASLELKEVQDEISELSERIIVAKGDLARTIILAPVSGSVQNLQVTTNGSVIRPGEILMEIVPEDADLLINARVSPTDIDSVTPGLETEVRFSAFKTKLTEIILGEVQSVSNDVITPDDSSVAPYYLARIYVSDEKMPANMRQRLTAGMPADVVIITGERSVLNYLTSPLTDAISKSLREE